MRQRTTVHAALAAGLLLLAPILVSAQPDVVLDLATISPADGKVRWVYGSTGTGRFGVPVAGGQDINGDGLPDYAVAFMTATAFGRSQAGEVDLIFGDGTVTGFVDTSVATDPRILRIAGAAARENAGSEIWVDDVDGDGIGDLLVCRQNFSPAGRNGAGALTILKGGTALTSFAAGLDFIDLANPPASLTLTTLIGAHAGDRLCIWARTGDVTGDGIADIVVAADQEDIGASNSGAAYVIRGGSHLFPAANTSIDLTDFGSTALPGDIARFFPPPGSTNFHLGATCQIADIDGNGRAEVMAAAALNRAGAGLQPPGGGAQSSGGSVDGTLYIAWDDNFSGDPWVNGLSFDISQSPAARTIINGENVNISFGEEILGGLDYDNDGKSDLFVGDLVADGTGSRPQSGIGYVFYDAATLKGLEFDLQTPPAGVTVTRLFGPVRGAIAGDTVAQGDFDNDGTDDLAFASPHAAPQGRTAAGAVDILFGQTGGWPALVDIANLPPPDILRVTEIRGAHGDTAGNNGDTLSYSAAAGDVDGDGHIDLITNEMVGDGIVAGTVDVGNLIVVSGAAMTAPGLTQAPANGAATVCSGHSVTATVSDGIGTLLADVNVQFTISSGPNVGTAEPHLSDSSGEAVFSYLSNGLTGIDTVQASFVDTQGITRDATAVAQDWSGNPPRCDTNGDGQIDRSDLSAIFAARRQPASDLCDTRDADANGLITITDARACVLQCTNPGCAP